MPEALTESEVNTLMRVPVSQEHFAYHAPAVPLAIWFLRLRAMQIANSIRIASDFMWDASVSGKSGK